MRNVKSWRYFSQQDFSFCCFPFRWKLFLVLIVVVVLFSFRPSVCLPDYCRSSLLHSQFDAITFHMMLWGTFGSGAARNRHFSNISLTVEGEHQEENFCTLSARANKKCPSTISITYTFIYIFIFFYFSFSSLTIHIHMKPKPKKKEKLLMSLFEKTNSFWWFFYKTEKRKSTELWRSCRTFFRVVAENKFAGENDKFHFDRWSESLIMIHAAPRNSFRIISQRMFVRSFFTRPLAWGFYDAFRQLEVHQGIHHYNSDYANNTTQHNNNNKNPLNLRFMRHTNFILLFFGYYLNQGEYKDIHMSVRTLKKHKTVMFMLCITEFFALHLCREIHWVSLAATTSAC